ncbi:MAG: c-type cytochrome [Nitrospirota bacterium]
MKKRYSLFIIISLLLLIAKPAGSEEIKGDANTGKAIYKKKCIACHGKNGEGLGPKSRMPNFKDSKRMATKTDKELFEKITKGGRGSGMPSFKSALKEEDRWNVIAYIRTFSGE